MTHGLKRCGIPMTTGHLENFSLNFLANLLKFFR